MLALVITIAACFAVQLAVVGPDWRRRWWSGFVPRPATT